MENLDNPITRSSSVTLKRKICVKDVIKLYNTQCKIDVSSFFENIKFVSLYECDNTGYRFFFPFKTSGDASFYEALQMSFEIKGQEYYRKNCYDHEFTITKLGKAQRLLEIGCGKGHFLQRIKEKGIETFGLELNDNAVKYCKLNGLNVTNDSIEDFSNFQKENFDIVCAFQVLEHVFYVGEFIRQMVTCLKVGGRLFISVPNNEPYFANFNLYETLNLPPHHCGLWNIQSLEKALELFNLKLVDSAFDESKSRWPYLTKAYFKAKFLFNIKSLRDEHNLKEKFYMGFLMIFLLPYYFLAGSTKKNRGSFLVAEFIKIS